MFQRISDAGRAVIADDFSGVIFDRRRTGDHRARVFKSDLFHGRAEFFAVFGLLNDVSAGTDHLDIIFFEDAGFDQIERAVERGLSAHGGEQRVRSFPGDDFLDEVRGDRLDIGCVGELRVGHNRRRVRIDEDDPEAFFLQRLHCLNAGIVELAGLADDDRPGADDQDGRDVGAFAHFYSRATPH